MSRVSYTSHHQLVKSRPFFTRANLKVPDAKSSSAVEHRGERRPRGTDRMCLSSHFCSTVGGYGRSLRRVQDVTTTGRPSPAETRSTPQDDILGRCLAATGRFLERVTLCISISHSACHGRWRDRVQGSSHRSMQEFCSEVRTSTGWSWSRCWSVERLIRELDRFRRLQLGKRGQTRMPTISGQPITESKAKLPNRTHGIRHGRRRWVLCRGRDCPHRRLRTT